MKEKSLYGIINDDDTLTGVIHQEKYYVKITPIIPLIDKSKVYIKSSILGKTILESLARGWGKIVALIDASAELSSSVRGKGRVRASVEGSTSVNVVLGEQASLYDSDVQAWLDLITDKPSATQNDYVNIMIKNMKSGLGVERMMNWSDTFYHFAAETAEASLKNMVKDAHHAVAVNGPVHTPFEGWGGDGISSYIDINYNPATDGDNISQNNICAGHYGRTEGTPGVEQEWGASRNGSPYQGIGLIGWYQTPLNMSRAGVGAFRNLSSYNWNMGTDETAAGQYHINRNHADYFTGRKNKKDSIIVSVASLGFYDGDVYICAGNLGGSAVNYSTRQISMFYISRAMTVNEQDVVTDEFQALMTKNGKQV